MEVSPGWRPSLSYLVHPDIASLASRPPLGISGAPLKARSRDLEAGGPRTFSGLDPGRSPPYWESLEDAETSISIFYGLWAEAVG